MKLIGQKALANYLQCSQGAITKWVSLGLPGKLIGLHRYEFETEEVLEWLYNKSVKHRKWIRVLRERDAANK